MVISFVKSEPYRMAKEFLEKVESRDISGAYDLTTEAYKSAKPFKEFKEIANKLNSVDISHPKEKERYMEEIPGMGQYAHIKYKVSGYYVDINRLGYTLYYSISYQSVIKGYNSLFIKFL